MVLVIFCKCIFLNTPNSNNALSAFAFKSGVLSKDGLSLLNYNIGGGFIIFMLGIVLSEHSNFLA